MEVDTDPQVPLLLETAPARLLLGDSPRLLDEWQEQPKLWNLVRHEVDKMAMPAQFILTVSANPDKKNTQVQGGLPYSICAQ